MMKKLGFSLLLFVASQSYAQVVVVSDPTLAGLMNMLNAQAAKATAIEVADDILGRTTGFVINMASVKKLIDIINNASCASEDFSYSIKQAQYNGFYNCWLDNETNQIINEVMGAVDFVNMALNPVVKTDPAERLKLINIAIERYVRAQGRMRTVVGFVQEKIREKEKAIREREEMEDLAEIMVKY